MPKNILQPVFWEQNSMQSWEENGGKYKSSEVLLMEMFFPAEIS